MSLLVLFKGAATTATDGPLVSVQLVAGTWTDITADVLAVDRIRWRRGIAGGGPLDCVAGTGVLEFSLRNDASNSGATRGWYSPNTSNARTGWTFGIKCRLQYRFSNTVYPLWTGKIRTIFPTPGIMQSRKVLVTAQDGMGDLATSRIRDVPAQFDETEQDLIQTVIDALPAAAAPPSSNIDTGLDTYPFAFDDLATGANALSVLTDVVRSAFGRLYTTADGTLRYRNRHNLALATSALTLTDSTLSGELEVPSSLANVYNRVRITVHPKTLGATDTIVLYSSPSIVLVGAGATVIVWGTYTDADNTLRTVGGKDFQTVTAYTDYEANTLETGLGTDGTASMTVTAEPFASTVKLTLVNASGTDLYMVAASSGDPLLQFRGRPILDLAPLTVEAGTVEDYGERLLELDLRYQDDVNVAQDMADFIHTQYLQLGQQVELLTVDPRLAGTATALNLDVTDVVTVTETMTGLNSATLAIQGIDGEIQPAITGGYVLLTIHAAPVLAQSLWLLDDPTYSVLDSTTILAWG